jgi:hypothetical protein
MGIKFHARLNDRRDELFVVARGEDRPHIIAEATGLLEAEGLYVSSIAFNLTSPDQDQFSMEIVAKGPDRKLEKALLAFDSDWPLAGKPESEKRWPKIRWSRASMFHLGLNTPDRAGIVAGISRIIGELRPSSAAPSNEPLAGSFVHLLGIIDNSGDSAQGGTPYFNMRANVVAQTPQIRDAIIQQLKDSSSELGFGDDLWIIPLDQPDRT